jgi:hypothetical protein
MAACSAEYGRRLPCGSVPRSACRVRPSGPLGGVGTTPGSGCGWTLSSGHFSHTSASPSRDVTRAVLELRTLERGTTVWSPTGTGLHGRGIARRMKSWRQGSTTPPGRRVAVDPRRPIRWSRHAGMPRRRPVVIGQCSAPLRRDEMVRPDWTLALRWRAPHSPCPARGATSALGDAAGGPLKGAPWRVEHTSTAPASGRLVGSFRSATKAVRCSPRSPARGAASALGDAAGGLVREEPWCAESTPTRVCRWALRPTPPSQRRRAIRCGALVSGARSGIRVE